MHACRPRNPNPIIIPVHARACRSRRCASSNARTAANATAARSAAASSARAASAAAAGPSSWGEPPSAQGGSAGGASQGCSAAARLALVVSHSATSRPPASSRAVHDAPSLVSCARDRGIRQT